MMSHGAAIWKGLFSIGFVQTPVVEVLGFQQQWWWKERLALHGSSRTEPVSRMDSPNWSRRWSIATAIKTCKLVLDDSWGQENFLPQGNFATARKWQLGSRWQRNDALCQQVLLPSPLYKCYLKRNIYFFNDAMSLDTPDVPQEMIADKWVAAVFVSYAVSSHEMWIWKVRWCEHLVSTHVLIRFVSSSANEAVQRGVGPSQW